jgi:hypothetical protein
VSFRGSRREVPARREAAGVTQSQGATKNPVETPICRAMKTVLIILLTTVWLASWTGIALGLSGCLTPPASGVHGPVAVANR